SPMTLKLSIYLRVFTAAAVFPCQTSKAYDPPTPSAPILPLLKLLGRKGCVK
ncbi:hypothetical protein L9F63_019815, partial [Diploptera punctata]